MDLMMPDMDGAETTRQLLAKDPDAKVLILTTFGAANRTEAVAIALRKHLLKV